MIADLIDKIFLYAYRHQLRGVNKLQSLLKIGGLSGRKIIARNKYGVILELDPDDYIDSFVLHEGFYESEVFEAALDKLPEKGVFWDVGSNSGHHAISMLALRPNAQVIAFEPSPREIAKIYRSANLNSVTAQILPIALDQETELKPFHICINNSGRNALDTWGDTSFYYRTLVQCFRADDLVHSGHLSAPNVIKIDVEGAELNVLKGMCEILQNSACIRIIFEAGIDVLDSNNPINKLLGSFGFQIFQLSRNESTHHNLENFVADRTL